MESNTGFYRGKVVQHLDSGRCKIFIPGIYQNDTPENLPPAEQASPLFGGTNLGNGMFSYPNIGSVVWCFFENGDQNRPVYFASTLGGPETTSDGGNWKIVKQFMKKDDTDPGKDSEKNGTDAKLHLIKSGNTSICLDQSTNQITIECRKRVAKDENGNETTGGESFSTITLNENGTIDIKTTSSISVKSPDIDINADNSLNLHGTNVEITGDKTIKLKSPELTSENIQSFEVKTQSATINAATGTINLMASSGGYHCNI